MNRDLDQSSLDTQIEDNTTHLKNIIALMPGHVYWVNRKNIYLGCNDLQAETLGLKSREDIVGKTTFDLLEEKDAVAIDAINKKVMETGIPYRVEEKGMMLTGERYYLSEKVPLRNTRGEIIGLLGISFDITDRKRMEQALKEAKEKSEIANQIKDEFIRNMEHDIRTPVSGIIGVSQCLKSLESDPQKNNFLMDIENASQELMNYFNDILEFSNLESGRVPVLFKKFDLKNLVHSIINMELPAAKNKNLELMVEYSDNTPSILLGDRYRIQRILINLVSNAIKFTEKGYVKIIVATLKSDSDREIIAKIAIEDTGIGISEEKQNFLYEKFNRGDSANKNLHKGQGLGLRIVKQFINEIDGEIEIHSQPGNGTTFNCILPLRLPLLHEL